MKKTTIILHGSASKWGDRSIIEKWHKERGWAGCGYNLIIENGFQTIEAVRSLHRDGHRDGKMTIGRDLNANPDDWAGETGAHALGHNAESIGICLIGDEDSQHTRAQIRSALIVCAYLCNLYSIAWSDVVGHYEIDDKKIDPYMSMPEFRDYLLTGMISRSMPESVYHDMMEVEV